MSAARHDVDPGPVPLPQYPPLVLDGLLVLPRLEEWLMAVTARRAELDELLSHATTSADLVAIVARLDEFEAGRRRDTAWVAGWMGGRLASVVCADHVPEAWRPRTASPTPAYVAGWAAGLVASAERFEALGLPVHGAARRSVADLVYAATEAPA